MLGLRSWPTEVQVQCPRADYPHWSFSSTRQDSGSLLCPSTGQVYGPRQAQWLLSEWMEWPLTSVSQVPKGGWGRQGTGAR